MKTEQLKELNTYYWLRTFLGQRYFAGRETLTQFSSTERGLIFSRVYYKLSVHLEVDDSYLVNSVNFMIRQE